MPNRSRKQAKDTNEIAASVVSRATGGDGESQRKKKNPAAVALGRLGGRKGGPARAKSLNAKRRKEIAAAAAKARWAKRAT